MIILHRHLLVVTYVCNDTSQLTLINARGGLRNHHHPSENRVFSATEHQMNPGPLCKFEFYRCGPVEKN